MLIDRRLRTGYEHILLIILIILIRRLPTLPYRMTHHGNLFPDRNQARDASRGHNASVMGTSTQRTWLRPPQDEARAHNGRALPGYHRFPTALELEVLASRRLVAVAAPWLPASGRHRAIPDEHRSVWQRDQPADTI
jgi:hypothetical protein